MTLRTLEQRQILDQAAKIKRAENDARRASRKITGKALKVARKLSPSRGQREPREKNTVYLAWIRRLPCVADLVVGGCSGGIEAAHLRYSDAKWKRVNPGMQNKSHDRLTTPLCTHHHQSDQHKRKEAEFWSALGIEPGQFTADLYNAFLAGSDGLAVIRAHAVSARASMRDDRSVHADANTCGLSTITSEGAG